MSAIRIIVRRRTPFANCAGISNRGAECGRDRTVAVAIPLSVLTDSVRKQPCHRSHVTRLTYSQISPPPSPFKPFQFVRRARRNVPLSAVGHAMRLAGELHRPLASRMTPSLTHDVTNPSMCVWKNDLSRSSRQVCLLTTD